METRTIGNTDLAVSRVCFGTMTFGSQVDEAAALRIVDRCLESGINFFDTANVYNKGISEQIVGKALKGRRDRIVLASKVRGKMGDAPDESGLSPAAIRKGIDDSLRRLGTDYLDLSAVWTRSTDKRPVEEPSSTCILCGQDITMGRYGPRGESVWVHKTSGVRECHEDTASEAG